jgi:hypothetical protein
MIPAKSKSLPTSKSLSGLKGPGPGDYVISTGDIGNNRHRNRKNIMISTASRDMRPQSDAPGPGYYNLHSSQSDSILKPSFNIMLDNGKY